MAVRLAAVPHDESGAALQKTAPQAPAMAAALVVADEDDDSSDAVGPRPAFDRSAPAELTLARAAVKGVAPEAFARSEDRRILIRVGVVELRI